MAEDLGLSIKHKDWWVCFMRTQHLNVYVSLRKRDKNLTCWVQWF